MVLKLKRLHLNQQAQEREDLKRREIDAEMRKVDSFGMCITILVFDIYTSLIHLIYIIHMIRIYAYISGNPESAVFVPDGYTVFQTLTPKVGHRFTSKEAAEKRISCRLIGVKVTCGPIKKFFNYYAPDLVAGGANLTIEVMSKG